METSEIKDKDFIVFGLQPWDIPIGSNCKNIAAELSKYNRVLYVNRPLDRMSYHRGSKDIQTRNRIAAIRRGENVLTEIKSNLWVFNPGKMLESINMLPAGFLYNFLNKRNNKLLAGEISKASKQLGFTDPILFVDNDFFNALYLKDFLQPQLFIFYIRDYLRSQQYFGKHGKRAEPLIMKKADGVAANSAYLARYASQFNTNVADVGQGCEVEDFLEFTGPKPNDISAIPYPIIGYVGSITSTRLDINLLEEIAASRSDWNIVLVGPTDTQFEQSKLVQMSNVHFLGAKSQQELASYVHAFDVCINPQLLNQMTIGNYPRKVDEYLAAGKPVVATRTETMEMFGTNAFLCNGAPEYVEAIEKALNEQHDPQKVKARIAMGAAHTWKASVDQIYHLIKKTQHGRGTG
ncbi:MAG: glycosyltransferase family 1 protein [Chitinophagaceae bacterium]|nr:MAG: glycosyltransferase family 1 protein [Chitinophagaceae bacterium]